MIGAFFRNPDSCILDYTDGILGEEHRSFGATNGMQAERYYMPQRKPGSQSTKNLGPLPRNWEIAYTEGGDKYYIE